MKKILVSIICLSFVLMTDISYAQLEIKPAIGINFTDFSEDPASGETSAKVGWQIGGTVLIGDKLYGEGGIFWTYRSTEYNSSDDQITFNTEISGIRIPAMIGYYLLKEEATLIGLRTFGGASILIVTTVKAFELSKDDFNSANWGVFIGAGLDISMFFVDLKYEWSLTNVSSISTFDVGKSRSIFINAGVRLSL